MKTKTHRGFTVIELMIAVTVASILLTVAVPNFLTLIANNRITSQANELIGGFNLARSEAAKRGQKVSICSSTNGSACASSTNWATGWIVFNDPDGDGAVANASDVLREWESVSGNSILTGSVNFITYQGDGSVNTSASINMNIPDGTANETRRLCVALAGNHWVNRPSSSC